MRRFGIVTGGVCILLAGFASQFTVLAAPPPKGPSVGDVYAVNAVIPSNQLLCDQASCTPITIATVVVPAGSYTIAAKVVISRWLSSTQALSFCYLYAGTETIDSIGVGTSLEVEYVPGALLGARTFSAQETLSLKCYDNSGQTAVQNWQLMATRVGTLNSVAP